MIVVSGRRARTLVSDKAACLYTDALFVAQKQYAVSTGRLWVVVSRAHGVVLPGVVLRGASDEPSKLRTIELGAWARMAATQLEVLLESQSSDERTVELLVPERYERHLGRVLDEFGIAWSAPLAGLGGGERLQKLGAMLRGGRTTIVSPS